MRVARHVGWMGASLLALACGVLPAAQAAPATASTAQARLTLLDGEASLIDGASRQAAVVGLPLAERTLIETSAATRLLRIEWPDGQVIDLGPSTRAMLSPPRQPGRTATAALYLLQGWAKHASPGAAGGQWSPRLELPVFRGTVVSFVSPAQSWLFVEAGQASVLDRGLPGAAIALPAGSAYKRHGSEKGQQSARPEPAAMQAVPRAFREPLPSRFETLKAATPKPQPLPPPTYAELQPWLSAEPAIRDGFVRRFEPLLRDRAFRRALTAGLRDHGEWQPVLFPPSVPTSAPTSAPARSP